MVQDCSQKISRLVAQYMCPTVIFADILPEPQISHCCQCMQVHNFMPYFGIATRYTRGMTYDMRCLPKIKQKYVPWGYGTMYPNHYGKCLELR